MAPARTGSIEPLRRADGTRYYRARVWLADGTRARVLVPVKYCGSEERAKLYAEAAQEQEDETGELLAAKRARLEAEAQRSRSGAGETCDEYFARLSKVRQSDGVRGVTKERQIWKRWMAPTIGSRPIATVTRDEIENVRDELDARVRERIGKGLDHGVSGATAENVWSVLRRTFKEARSARDRTFRVRQDDPSEGHKPPLKTREREKTFLYPVEVSRLLACSAVPREWREVYAIATYTYVRPEELEALTWGDIDLEANVVHVSKAIDSRSGEVKQPKTPTAVRAVPIEARLRPLLVGLKPAPFDRTLPLLPVLRKVNDKHRAKLLREHLAIAGVDRVRLLEDTPTLRPIDFRSCRDSGLTWLILARVELAAAQRRAGHTEIKQTLAYCKLAEDLSGRVGEPFPPLPPSLIPTGHVTGHLGGNMAKTPRKRVPEEGVEPPT